MASNDWLKMTIQKAGAMNKHNGKEERAMLNHSNVDIDVSKSHLNMYIGCTDYAEAVAAMKKRVSEVDAIHPPKRMNGKNDRIVCFSVEIPCPAEIARQGYEEAQQFFYDVYELYKDFFGKENVHGGMVHFDEVHEYTDKDGQKRESLPHMHTLVSAYVEWTDKNKRTGKTEERKGINGKNFCTKARMKKLNQIVDEYTTEVYGVNFLTGETPQRKSVEHLKAQEKVNQEKARLNQIQEQLRQEQLEYDQLHTSRRLLQEDVDSLKAQMDKDQQELEQQQEKLNQIKQQIKDYYFQALDYYVSHPEPTEPEKPKFTALNQKKMQQYEESYQEYQKNKQLWNDGKAVTVAGLKEREDKLTEREEKLKRDQDFVNEKYGTYIKEKKELGVQRQQLEERKKNIDAEVQKLAEQQAQQLLQETLNHEEAHARYLNYKERIIALLNQYLSEPSEIEIERQRKERVQIDEQRNLF